MEGEKWALRQMGMIERGPIVLKCPGGTVDVSRGIHPPGRSQQEIRRVATIEPEHPWGSERRILVAPAPPYEPSLARRPSFCVPDRGLKAPRLTWVVPPGRQTSIKTSLIMTRQSSLSGPRL